MRRRNFIRGVTTVPFVGGKVPSMASPEERMLARLPASVDNYHLLWSGHSDGTWSLRIDAPRTRNRLLRSEDIWMMILES